MDALGGKSREVCPQPGNVVRIVGNKRFSSQKNKLAVVVNQPKSKQRKSPERGGSPKSLPIGGWHYIICLSDGSGEADLKPSSVQGNAIKLERPTAEERAAADDILQQYEQLQKQSSGSLSDSSDGLRRESLGSRDHPPQVEVRKDAQLKVEEYCNYCEQALTQQGISPDAIQTVTAGITLFGMRSEDEMDFMAMLREWKKLPKTTKRLSPPHPVQNPIVSVNTLLEKSSAEAAKKISLFAPQTPQMLYPLTHPAASHLGAFPQNLSPRVDSVVV